MNEIKEELKKSPAEADRPPVLVLASNESTCAQLIDLTKFGQRKLCWLQTKLLAEHTKKPFNVVEPDNQPIWPPHTVALYDEQVLSQVVSFFGTVRFMA